MQKKHFLLVVVSLALLTTVFFVGRSNMGYNLLSQMMGRDYMMDGVGGGYAVPEPMMYGGVTATPVMETKLAVDSVGIDSGMMVQPVEIMPPYYYGDDVLYMEERSYEKSSYHSVVVSDVTKYMRGLKEYFSSINGVILSSSVNSSSKYESASLYVKVPVEKFDEATTRVTEDVKKVIDESLNASDITGQVVNTEETVTYLQEQKTLKEAQLKDAKTEAAKAKIQIEIDRLTRQIEAAQKAQESVTTRTKYASLSVTAASNEKYFNPGTTGDFEYELQRAWESLKSFLKVLGVFGIWVAVYSVVWAPVVWIVSKIVNKFRK
ncbi:MAG: hypothetical protein BroJett025_08940 [Patescibacteria group bacterium]|nr:MAG: hypothetical protein BroJett025_08940 [Patescibacteria group bacterium]